MGRKKKEVVVEEVVEKVVKRDKPVKIDAVETYKKNVGDIEVEFVKEPK